MGVADRIERCHKCYYYREFKRCSIRETADMYNKECSDFKLKKHKRRARHF